MANSINKVQILGRLGRDPEVRSTQSGKTVTTITVATEESFGKGEEKKSKAEWHRITLWEKLGEIAGNYLKKGRQVFVEGRLSYRVEERDGKKTYYTDITATSLVLLGGKGEESEEHGREAAPAHNEASEYKPPAMDAKGMDEVPF